MYSPRLAAPRFAPSAPPVSSTASVWPVIGTGVNGSLMAICANTAVNIANPTTSATSASRLLPGRSESISVAGRVAERSST